MQSCNIVIFFQIFELALSIGWTAKQKTATATATNPKR